MSKKREFNGANSKINLLHGGCVSVSDLEGKEKLISPKKLDKWEGAIKITLDYPFEKEFSFEIEKQANAPWNTETIVSAIHDGYEYMYSKSKNLGSLPFLINQIHIGEFGTSWHVIEDLWIERLWFNSQTGEIGMFVGS